MQVAQWLGMDTLQWLIRQAIFASAVVVVILFQPELRAALDQLGRGHLTALTLKWNNITSPETARGVSEITKAIEQLAGSRTGALLVIERETGLDDIVATGHVLNARLSADFLLTLFYPGNPMHDGAVVLRDHTVVAAGCILPLSQTQALPRTVGTRHRAALGLSETTDAIVVVVSEETGNISLAHRRHHELDFAAAPAGDELLSLLGRAEGRAALADLLRVRFRRRLARCQKQLSGTLACGVESVRTNVGPSEYSTMHRLTNNWNLN
jgi:diadenylate cyclase